MIAMVCALVICTSCSDDSDTLQQKETPTVSNTLSTDESQISNQNSDTPYPVAEHVISAEQDSEKDTNKKPALNYTKLRNSIILGNASLVEVKQALTETDVVQLSNTLHALYSMRWHRGVYHLYYDLWHLKKEKYPDFAWDSLEKIPARIALASTINRAQIYDAEEFKDYIRAHMYDEHEFHRAQAVVALGLNGDPDDVEYIKSMADEDNHYVTQSAISSLAMVGHVKARDAMIELYEKYKGTPRGDLLLGLLKKAYKWQPEKSKANS